MTWGQKLILILLMAFMLMIVYVSIQIGMVR